MTLVLSVLSKRFLMPRFFPLLSDGAAVTTTADEGGGGGGEEEEEEASSCSAMGSACSMMVTLSFLQGTAELAPDLPEEMESWDPFRARLQRVEPPEEVLGSPPPLSRNWCSSSSKVMENESSS